MNHDPKTATATKKATFAMVFKRWFQLRGKDLNLRPLGYEGKSNLNTNQEKCRKANTEKVEGLHPGGWSWPELMELKHKTGTATWCILSLSRRSCLVHWCAPRMQNADEIFNLEIVTPWAERLMIQIAPPKPDVSIHPGPYRLVNQRCDYHGCNRLYTIAERGSKIYCSAECEEKSKSYRRKLERAGLAP